MANEQEKNKTIIVEMQEEVWNKGTYGHLSTVLAADFVDHPPKRAVLTADRGSEKLREEAAALREGFPDLHYQLIQIAAEGDRVTSLGRLTGTHTGIHGKLRPSGNPLDTVTITNYRLKDGKVVERWAIMDPVVLMSSLAASSAAPRAH